MHRTRSCCRQIQAKRWQLLVHIVVAVKGEANLLEVIVAGGSPRRLSCLLNCRQEQPNKNANNGDDYEQLNERETAVIPEVVTHSNMSCLRTNGPERATLPGW